MEAAGVDSSQGSRRLMNVLPFEHYIPKIHPSAYLAENVNVIGNVVVGADSSIWFNSVLRGDINSITIGDRTNVQDACVMHVTHECPVMVGSDVTVGHRAIIHGCTIGDACLIGMGSIVLDGAKVGAGSLVAAGAVVLQGFVVLEGSLVAGVPGRIIRLLTDDEKGHILQSASNYVGYAKRHQTRE